MKRALKRRAHFNHTFHQVIHEIELKRKLEEAEHDGELLKQDPPSSSSKASNEDFDEKEESEKDKKISHFKEHNENEA